MWALKQCHWERLAHGMVFLTKKPGWYARRSSQLTLPKTLETPFSSLSWKPWLLVTFQQHCGRVASSGCLMCGLKLIVVEYKIYGVALG